MGKIVGVKFQDCGKVYDFEAGHFVLSKGDKVMVITEDGPAIGVVHMEPHVPGGEIPERPLKKVFRLATEDEIARYEEGVSLEKSVFSYCLQRIKERSLPMSLVRVEKRFDGSKIVVFFTADGRVDFRDLVKDLVHKFRTRIEMRQIGVRHQAKMVGGLGTCGRPLCCASFLNTFGTVTIRMAKEQNLSLNPGKISGMCGRLMCCLTYEHKYYEKARKDLPKIGKRVKTKFGEGKVIRENIMKKTLTVALVSGEEKEVAFEELFPKDDAARKMGLSEKMRPGKRPSQRAKKGVTKSKSDR
jgi:cell fate regulator YaaT (PSP1 superfamily)